MYYYILEQPKSKAIAKIQENIRTLLGVYGIAGEIVTVSPARTTQELVEMGLNKNYTTIVAVGADKHINKISTFLKNKKAALGIIPIEASELIHQLIGTSDVKEACEILKYRKLKEINMGLIEPNKYFLTQAEIQSPVSIDIKLTVINPGFNSYEVKTKITEAIVSRNLYLFLTDKNIGNNFFEKYWAMIVGKKVEDKESSIIRGRKIKIETNEPFPITMDGEIIAKTPVVASLCMRALKVITKSVRIREENERKNEQTEN
jgi:diacylglycerol kinase family enzyme